MPGIAGIIRSGSRGKNREDLSVMLNCMMHESFYVSGDFVDEQIGVYTGLVSHRNSFAASMPVFSEKKNVALILSGENFLSAEIGGGLKRNGHVYSEHSPDYLIHIYEDDPNGFLRQLNGWFSGVLVDRRDNKVVLFNDRYGMGRIYYHECHDSFYFSSEAKSLLKIKPELREVDLKGLGEVFACGCVLENRTVFRNIRMLPGGSAWTFINGKCDKKEHYFSPASWEEKPVLGKEAFYRRLKEVVAEVVPRYFVAKDPIALSLTGGLDTRLIMAYRHDSQIPLPCYTFGGQHGDVLDVRIARKIALAHDLAHSVVRLDSKFFSTFQDVAERSIYITDGALDVCGSHELYLNGLARQIAPIRLTGNYGSEILRNASTFKAATISEELFHPDFSRYVSEARRTFSEVSRGNRLSVTAFKEVPWSLFGSLAAAQSQLTVRSPYMDNDLAGLAYQAPRDANVNKELFIQLITDIDRDFMSIRTDRGIGGGSHVVFSKLIQLLYAVWFKMEWYYNDGLPHWMSRPDAMLSPFHPERLILGHHKYLHYRLWFRNELSGYVREMLLDRRTGSRPYFNKKFVGHMVVAHLQGNGNYTNEINKAITTELLHRVVMEN